MKTSSGVQKLIEIRFYRVFQPVTLQTNFRNINPNESAFLGIILEQNFLKEEKV